jgi:general secretion pathway protein I
MNRTLDSRQESRVISQQMHKQAGFTLLEIMIALAVFAVVSAALVRNAAVAVRQTGQLQDRATAIWVAENHLNSLHMAPRNADNYPAPGIQRYPITMANRDWLLVVDTQATENETMRRIYIEVFAEGDEDVAVADLTGFVGQS